MFRGRLGGPLTVLHPESVTTTPLSTIWNNAFFTAAPFSFFPFLLFPFPFSLFLFLFPFFCPFFFLFLSPFHFFCPQPAVEIIWNHLSSLFSYWINSRNGINFSSVWWMLPKKLSSFCFVFLFFRLEYVLEEPGFSFLIDSRLFLPCFWSETKNVWYPFPPNRQPQTWRFFVFYPQAFSIIANLLYKMYISRVPQLTCILMSLLGASALGNLTSGNTARIGEQIAQIALATPAARSNDFPIVCKIYLFFL